MRNVDNALPAPDGGGLSAKGLPAGSIGILGLVVIGISVCAPAYTLTASLGPAATQVGKQMPAVFFVSFIPMLLVAIGYRELNREMPDAGTSFTWATRAFGPWIGWIAGWGLVVSTVLVLSNTAAVAVDFMYLALGQALERPDIAALPDDAVVNIASCLGFMAVATWISCRGLQSTKRVQYVLVSFQVLVLAWFAWAAFSAAADGGHPYSIPVEWSWFNPFAVESFSQFAAGVAVSIFAYWGWDTVVTISEETTGDKRANLSGKAATLVMVLLVGSYVLISAAVVSFAGVGSDATGLANPAIAANVFTALAGPVMGPAAILLSLAVMSSSAASLQSTFMSPARTMLAMGHYQALPAKYAVVESRFKAPAYATVVSALVASVFYAVMRVVSENVLSDTITALGMMVCFYYGLTAFACVWYFRKQALTSARHFLLRGLCPGLGGILLFVALIRTTLDSMDPAFGSGSHIGGLGLVFILGVTVALAGLLVMLYMYREYPAFFRGEVLKKGSPVFSLDEKI